MTILLTPREPMTRTACENSVLAVKPTCPNTMGQYITEHHKMQMVAGKFWEFVRESKLADTPVCILDVRGMRRLRGVGSVTVANLVAELSVHWTVLDVLAEKGDYGN